jgi:hypothetical protein
MPVIIDNNYTVQLNLSNKIIIGNVKTDFITTTTTTTPLPTTTSTTTTTTTTSSTTTSTSTSTTTSTSTSTTTPEPSLLFRYEAASYTNSSTWVDTSGDSNTGTVSGSSPLSRSTCPQYVTFNGTNNFVYSTTQMAGPQEFTISAWFRTSAATGKKIVGLESGRSGTASFFFDRQMWVGTDGKLYFAVYDDRLFVNEGVVISSPSTVNDGTFKYAVATYDNVSKDMKLYINGTLVVFGTAFKAQDFNGYWRVGGYKNTYINGTDGYFNGDISSVSAHSRVLSAAEILTNYTSYLPVINCTTTTTPSP